MCLTLTSLTLFFPTVQKLFALCRLNKYQEAEELAEEESGHMDRVRHREGVGNSNRVCTSTALLTSSGFLSSLKLKVWGKWSADFKALNLYLKICE